MDATPNRNHVENGNPARNLSVFSNPLDANRRQNNLKLLSSKHNSSGKKVAKKKRDLCTCHWKYDVIREADNLSTPVLSDIV